ncbi:hypothetical protein SLS62_011049 [Diatrype stigma]|uniref:Short-chain dehydrogenase n=1 Tax=Diatrype stigma TaxID=117547 RepID=A0AAN9U638_9PEZI
MLTYMTTDVRGGATKDIIDNMAGTVVFTGANSSAGIPAVEYLLRAYPDYTAVLTVRNASNTDPNTQKLRETIAQFPSAKASIHELDLSSLAATHAFADTVASGIANGEYPPIAAIVCNAYYWNLVGDPEITADGYDKTIQVTYISHAALVLRLIGNFGDTGRVVFVSADAHWAGKNMIEVYPPVLISDSDLLVKPTTGPDKQGYGFQRYASAKLAVTTWMHALNRRLQKEGAWNGNNKMVTAVAIDPGNLADSRALRTNTARKTQMMQKFLLVPLLPILQYVFPTARTAAVAGVDLIELAVGPKYAGERGYFTLLQKGESAPDSQNEAIQQRLWKKTLEWTKITRGNTALKAAFD